MRQVQGYSIELDLVQTFKACGQCCFETDVHDVSIIIEFELINNKKGES